MNSQYLKTLVLLLPTIGVAMFSSAVYGAECTGVTVDVCSRPGTVSCETRIVDAINGAQSSLDVQAYSFTAVSIIQAIGNAKKRGVDVRVVLDKENQQKRYTGATYLTNADVHVRIDDTVAIAHNKVMVIDSSLTIGGSYNYTASAEKRNAENVTFMSGSCVADQYRMNFEKRCKVARPYPGKQP